MARKEKPYCINCGNDSHCKKTQKRKESEHIKDKMIDKEDGKPQKLYQSMLDNALALCETLKSLNIMNDPDLEAARRALELSLTDVDIKSLRQSPEVRDAIKVKMQDLTDKFSLEL